jgi:hypothetical protein
MAPNSIKGDSPWYHRTDLNLRLSSHVLQDIQCCIMRGRPHVKMGTAELAQPAAHGQPHLMPPHSFPAKYLIDSNVFAPRHRYVHTIIICLCQLAPCAGGCILVLSEGWRYRLIVDKLLLE